jgi:hypothetical protein
MWGSRDILGEELHGFSSLLLVASRVRIRVSIIWWFLLCLSSFLLVSFSIGV